MTWRHHPGVRSGDQLTLGERAADRMRAAMGSWAFIFSFLGVMCLWAFANVAVLEGAFDPYPFILLNLLLSTLAGLQGGILLIAAKRADQISSELAMHDYETNVAAKQVIDAVHSLTKEVHDHLLGE